MEDDRPPRYGLLNRARKAVTGNDYTAPAKKPPWDEDEAPFDQQLPEPIPPGDISIASSSQLPAVNVGITAFWWIWENWCGFTGYLSRQNVFGDGGLAFTSYMMAVTDFFEAFFSMIGRIIRVFWGLLAWIWNTLFRWVYIGGFPLPIIFWYFIALLLLYLLNAYWQLILTVVIDVVTPILNLLILITNFVVQLLVILMRITFQIWNIFVPFIGMFIYVVLDLIVTILQIVFDILQSDGLMNILQALFEIIFFLVDIAMQILMVFLQIGMPILQILAELLSFILELIFVVIEIVLEILVWILDLLFKILEPILLIIQALCAAFSWMVSAGSSFRMGRKLLSTGFGIDEKTIFSMNGASGMFDRFSADEALGKPTMEMFATNNNYFDFVSSTYSQYAKHVVYNSTSHHLTGMQEEARQFFMDPELWNAENEIDDWFAQHQTSRANVTPMDRIKRDITLRAAGKQSTGIPHDFGQPGRKLLEMRTLVDRNAIGKGLMDDFQTAPDLETTKMDKTSEVFMSHFHAGVQKMVHEPTTNLDLMHHTFSRVRDHQRRGRDDLAMQSIIEKVNEQHPELAGTPPGPAWVRYNDVEHPHMMHMRLQNERNDFADSKQIPRSYRAFQQKMVEQRNTGGRTLLEVPKTWMNDHQVQAAEHLRNMEVQHAKQIRDQHNTYVDHHYKRVLTSKAVIHGVRGRVLHHAQNTLHFDNFAYHTQNILERYGYKSVKEAYHDFLKTHKTAENFVLSLSYISELPGISFLKQYDERRHSHPFFHDWHQAQREEEELREQAYGPTARKLLRIRPSQGDARVAARVDGEEDPAGRGTSKEKFEGLEIISKTDCFSIPRNPLCLPEIPADLAEKLEIPEIKIDERLKEDSDLCDPWQPSADVLEWQRLMNGIHSIRFIISGLIPPLNYLLTTFTLLVPWLSWTVDWVFIVDKGERASFAQVFCFFIHIYDLILLYLFVRIIWFLLKSLDNIFGGFFGDIIACRQREKDFEEKIIQQRTNDSLLEQEFRANTLLENERRRLDEAEEEEESKDQIRLGAQMGVTNTANIFQVNFNGHFHHEHPYSQHHLRSMHRVSDTIDSEERHRELFIYYSYLLQRSLDLEGASFNPVAVAASWRNLCKKYPEILNPDYDGSFVDISVDDYASSTPSSSTPHIQTLPYMQEQ